jgi:hypothetical protein
MTTATLSRTLFETPRAAEYFSLRELEAMTGQPAESFAAVALKELVDNALDAGETAGVSPQVEIQVLNDGEALHLEVSDNAGGIPSAAVQRLLNFSTRLSDKAAYRSPTRGLQGNALKTIIGMPHAFGLREPVVISSSGVRHSILAWVDPAGQLRVEYGTTPVPTQPGTTVSLTLPAHLMLDARYWARAFSLFNPHAAIRMSFSGPVSQLAYRDDEQIQDFYHSLLSFPKDWTKFLPTDPTSPWWYTPEELTRLVFSHIAQARQGDRDLPLREFVRQFRGLTGTGKAKAVCSRLPHISRLSDFEADPAAVALLLEAMKAEARAPSPSVLGLVGADSFRTRFHQWYGVKRSWYRKVSLELPEFPFTFEVALAETERVGSFFSAINFSPTFEDPSASTPLSCPNFTAYGALGFLSQAHASPTPRWDEPQLNVAAAVHLVCPSPTFLDRGKTRLKLPPGAAERIAETLWGAGKELHREGERRRKDAARQERADRQRQVDHHETWSLKDAVFQVLPEAVHRATGDGLYPVSSRTLYYQVRPLVQGHTSRELDYTYFSQQLLTEYQQAYGKIDRLYYDPRGVLHEPHSGRTVQLGTREVESYRFPHWLYNKILYVEKRGLWPILQEARLAQRYDMAVVAAEGYSNEACRMLFQDADQREGFQLFVLHDADVDGYNIARTLREETRRMPGYQVEVIDLGLRLEDGLALGLATEEATRKKALPEGLELNEVEQRYFQGRQAGKNLWVCQRIELNALSAPQLVEYVETQLHQAGASGKVIPSDDQLPELAAERYRAAVSQWVDERVAQLLSLDSIKAQVADGLASREELAQARRWVEEGFEQDSALSWREAVDRGLEGVLRTRAAEMEALVWGLLGKQISGNSQSNSKGGL